jgi:YD repeat-containing protein
VGQIVFKSNTVTRMTTSKQYDFLNRLSSISSTPSNAFTYQYNADGNLLSDRRWTNTWDAENRLVGLTSLSTAPSGSKLQLAFAYDYMGRRIQKTVYTNNGTSYIGEYTNKFAYDGWNCFWCC